MAIELPKDAEGRDIPLDTKVLYDADGNQYEVSRFAYSVLRDYDNWDVVFVKAGCTECHTFAQIDYVFTGPLANECRPDDVQLTREVIERWNEHCDDWEGIFNHE